MRLAADAWREASCEIGDPATLEGWLAQGHPLIVRRPCVTEDGCEIFLGLALPGKRRLAYRIPVRNILSIEPPPLWRGETFRIPGVTLRLFGSHAWQELTGLSYITETSDIDLLADISSPAEWRAFLAREVELPSRPRVDLELILRGDASFSWREYRGAARDVLIKSNRRVWLECKDNLAALLA